MSTTRSTREDWLVAAIETDTETIALFELVADDPIAKIQAERLTQDRDLKVAELAKLRSGPRMRVRLSGGAIQGVNAPGSVVATVVETFGRVASEHAANFMVAPAEPGSYVIEFVGPEQLDLTDEGPGVGFVEAADVLLSMAPETYPKDLDRADVVRQRAGEMSDDSLRAMKAFVGELARHRITANIELSSLAQSTRVRLDESYSAFLDLELSQLSFKRDDFTVRGTLIGFTQGSGRFEIRNESTNEIIAGRVPAKARKMGEGISIGERVVAVIKQTVTTRRSGGSNTSYRLDYMDTAEA